MGETAGAQAQLPQLSVSNPRSAAPSTCERGQQKSDNVKAWELSLDGSYVRADGGKEPRIRSQYRFMELARERARDPELARTRTLAPAQPPGVTIVNKLRKGKRKKKGRRRDDD